MDLVNERSGWFTDISFTDENGQPVVPTSATYRIDDVGSGDEVRGDTDVPGLAQTARIPWEADDTAIIDEAQPYETRRMTVSWKYMRDTSPPAEADGHAEYLLEVRNLAGVGAPSPA